MRLQTFRQNASQVLHPPQMLAGRGIPTSEPGHTSPHVECVASLRAGFSLEFPHWRAVSERSLAGVASRSKMYCLEWPTQRSHPTPAPIPTSSRTARSHPSQIRRPNTTPGRPEARLPLVRIRRSDRRVDQSRFKNLSTCKQSSFISRATGNTTSLLSSANSGGQKKLFPRPATLGLDCELCRLRRSLWFQSLAIPRDNRCDSKCRDKASRPRIARDLCSITAGRSVQSPPV